MSIDTENRCSWPHCRHGGEVFVALPGTKRMVDLCDNHLGKYLETRGDERERTIDKLKDSGRAVRA
jgi:hypothetical protein